MPLLQNAVADTTDAAYAEEAVRKLANRLRGGDRDGFRSGVSQLVGSQVRRNSQVSMAANCERAGVRRGARAVGLEDVPVLLHGGLARFCPQEQGECRRPLAVA